MSFLGLKDLVNPPWLSFHAGLVFGLLLPQIN